MLLYILVIVKSETNKIRIIRWKTFFFSMFLFSIIINIVYLSKTQWKNCQLFDSIFSILMISEFYFRLFKSTVLLDWESRRLLCVRTSLFFDKLVFQYLQFLRTTDVSNHFNIHNYILLYIYFSKTLMCFRVWSQCFLLFRI